ncbi:MAG: HindVP family restriction endonuclease [Chloroflexi bacterium]|nr:HindVP family restriction endonuclease [Chloroflexota bacterium]MCC6893426.1 HindVP family restriction endonuclease [Anaerolineae bacterium]
MLNQTLPHPTLFGITNSNRDFRKAENWGKNIFNNAFPVALACYMDQKGINPVYLTINGEGILDHSYIPTETVFAFPLRHPSIYFSFESDFIPYQPLVVNNLPRADLVIMDQETGLCKRGLEIKLTALPDNSTAALAEELYGCEIVVRPDTIVYLALSIASQLQSEIAELERLFNQLPLIRDWTDIAEVAPIIPRMADILNTFMMTNLHLQQPLVLQPVWKTEGKKLILHKDAFDIFVWSNFAFTRLFFREALLIRGGVSRGARSIAWLTKMLIDFVAEGKFNHKAIIDTMSFNTKNDKAFAVNGMVTRALMNSLELVHPRIQRDEIRNIILGNGEKLLSPERRLDAAIMNTTGLFGD